MYPIGVGNVKYLQIMLWSKHLSTSGDDQGRIQDFVLEGTKVGEGSGDRLRSPTGPCRALCPSRGPRGATLRKLLGFEYLGSFSVNNFEALCECDEVY